MSLVTRELKYLAAYYQGAIIKFKCDTVTYMVLPSIWSNSGGHCKQK